VREVRQLRAQGYRPQKRANVREILKGRKQHRPAELVDV
jgi:hypothetical protein